MSNDFNFDSYEEDTYFDMGLYKDDKKLHVKFHMRPIKHEFRSQEEGRPCFVELEYVTIMTPGSKDTFVTEVTEMYKRRFPEQYKAFKANQEAPVSGTPLSELPWLTAGQVLEFRALNVRTVEQLVEMPDALAQKFMGIAQIQQRAKRFLDAAAGEAPAMKLEAELKSRDEQLAAQEKRLKALEALLEKASKPAAK